MSSGSPTKVSRLKLLRLALQRYERAKMEGGVHVTQLARPRGKGSSAEAGRKYHRGFVSMPIDDIVSVERWEGAFPIAWRFRFGWLYGIADSVVFVRGLPVAVVELKSGGVSKGAREQAALYGLLVALNFLVKPRVLVRTPGGVEEVEDWELLALEALAARSRS